VVLLVNTPVVYDTPCVKNPVRLAFDHHSKISVPGVTVLELLKATPKVVGKPEQTDGDVGVALISAAVAYGFTLTVTVNGLPMGALEILTGVTV
jgi:hypothetical protein